MPVPPEWNVSDEILPVTTVWGGGFTTQFESPTSVVDASTHESPTRVVDAWKKLGNVSDKALEVQK